MSSSDRGRRIGWLGGGVGSLIWLLLAAIARGLQGDGSGALLAAGLFGAGLAYLIGFAPWRWPRTPVALLYGGLVGLLATAALLLLEPEWRTLRPTALLPLLVLLLPIFILGRRTWRELDELPRWRDNDRCG